MFSRNINNNKFIQQKNVHLPVQLKNENLSKNFQPPFHLVNGGISEKSFYCLYIIQGISLKSFRSLAKVV